MRTKPYIVLCLLLAASCAKSPVRSSFVWWEAESPIGPKFAPTTSVSPATDRERDVLSGGDWLTRPTTWPSTDAPVEVAYNIDVPTDGAYQLWVRKFGGGELPFSFDGQQWRKPDAPSRAVDSEPLDIRADRYFGVAWYKLGEVTLKSGRHTFAIQLWPGKAPLAIDCFTLVAGKFYPNSKAKPGQKLDRAPAGWFAFEPDHDSFAESAMDLSRLNEKSAGDDGRIVRRGTQLVHEKTGQAIRFWGVTSCADCWMIDKADMDYLARRLAKMGVNFVRLHVAPYYETTPGPQTDGVHYLIAALKKHGIYSGVNWYCSAVSKAGDAWPLEGFKKGEFPFAGHLFYPPVQESYKKWAANLLGSKNPYTGMTLAEDPALAYVELVDEDNYFWYSLDPANINPKALPFLERKFGQWAASKYGSIDKALAAWGDGPKPKVGTDDAAQGRMGLYPAVLLGGASWATHQRNPKRASDQAQFMVEDERAWYTSMRQFLKDKVGYNGLILGTNWKAADQRVLGPLDKYADMALDLTANNSYFGGPQTQSRFFPWMVGVSYADESLLLNPQQELTMQVQYDRPHLITEGGYQMINRFRTEAPLLMASYLSLQGIAGYCPFQLEPDWTTTLHKWPTQTPATMGQSPAAALIYRMGYVKEGPVAVDETLDLADLYALKGAAASAPLGLDAAKATQVPEGSNATTQPVSKIDPLSFYVGRVMRHVGDGPAKLDVLPEMGKLIDHEKKTVRSATGELALDYERGALTMNAPCAQGWTGFCAVYPDRPIHLRDVEIIPGNEYGAIVVVSLDGKPISQSDQMLLQVMTEEQNYGWTTATTRMSLGKGQPERDAKTTTDIGAAPIVVQEICALVSLSRPDAAKLKVTALDFNGYRGEVVGNAAAVWLRPRTLYYLIER